MKNENVRTIISDKIIPVIALMTSQRCDRNLFLFFVKAVELGDEFCLDLLGAQRADGKHLGLYSNCRATKKQLIFPSAGSLIPIFKELIAKMIEKIILIPF